LIESPSSPLNRCRGVANPSMATPTTYSVHVSSETHKIEAWVASDEALARQLQEEENARDAAADTREFAGTAPLSESVPSSECSQLTRSLATCSSFIFNSGNVSLESSSPAVEYRPAQNAPQVCCLGTLLVELFGSLGLLSYSYMKRTPFVSTGRNMTMICIHIRLQGKTMWTQIICHTRYADYCFL